VFLQKDELQFSDWKLGAIEKSPLLKEYIFLDRGYIPEKILVYKHLKYSTYQFIVPFFMEEGSIKITEQLAELADSLNRVYHEGVSTKILVIYPDASELAYDVIRKNKKNSKDDSAMATSKMLFIYMTNFFSLNDIPKLFNESKKRISYSTIIEI